MEEQQINNQIESQTNNNSSANLLDTVSAVAAISGAVASIFIQQVAVAAFPLALSVGVHLFNRRQSINDLQQHLEKMVLQQNLHIVNVEQRLQAVEEQLKQSEKESWLALETQDQDHKTKIGDLSQQINQLQQQTSDLNQSTQFLESKQKQLIDVVEELRQLENYSQALRTEPSAAEVHYQRGYSHQRLGDKNGAIEDYSEAIRLDPKYAQAYHSRGILYAETGKRKLAVADLRQASKWYFEQGDIDSYQKARDLGKELYDLRDVMEEKITINAQTIAVENEQPEKPNAEENNNGKIKFKALTSVSVEHLFS